MRWGGTGGEQASRQASKRCWKKKKKGDKGEGCCRRCCGTDAVVAQRASTRSTVPSGRCAVNVYDSTYSRYCVVRTRLDHVKKGSLAAVPAEYGETSGMT